MEEKRCPDDANRGQWWEIGLQRPARRQTQECLSSGNRDPAIGLMVKAKTSGARGLGRSKQKGV